MPDDHIDKEIEAIKTVLNVLEPLEVEVRSTVLEYVLKRLGMNNPLTTNPPLAQPPSVSQNPPAATLQAPSLHIKEFKQQKKPRSANEMAALVAYFLSNVVPTPQRKDSVNVKDIETYFKIAEFPLPEQIKMTLTNAKNAGYFDLAGDGEYKLNAVGHNLVVHSMPRGDGAAAGKKARKASKNKSKSQHSKK